MTCTVHSTRLGKPAVRCEHPPSRDLARFAGFVDTAEADRRQQLGPLLLKTTVWPAAQDLIECELAPISFGRKSLRPPARRFNVEGKPDRAAYFNARTLYATAHLRYRLALLQHGRAEVLERRPPFQERISCSPIP